jgi:hypothetical protein
MATKKKTEKKEAAPTGIKRPRKALLDKAIEVFTKAKDLADRIASLDLRDTQALGSNFEDLSNNAMLALSEVETLKADGFVPPVKAKGANGFKEGDAIKIKDEKTTKYAGKYTEIELHTMVYGFYDDVLHVVSCTTDGRVMFAKPRDIEARV